jgi:hypothetical protein
MAACLQYLISASKPKIAFDANEILLNLEDLIPHAE